MNGSTPGFNLDDPGTLNTNVVTNDLVIQQSVTGTNPAQPLGTRGIVTITLRNPNNGSIQNLEVTASLPAGYVVDNTFGPGAGLSPGDAGWITPKPQSNS